MAKEELPKVDLDFDTLTIPEKIAKGRKLIEFLTDNPDFPNPDPPLEQIKATIDKLEQFYNEAQLLERITAVSERKVREAQERFLKLLDETPMTWH